MNGGLGPSLVSERGTEQATAKPSETGDKLPKVHLNNHRAANINP